MKKEEIKIIVSISIALSSVFAFLYLYIVVKSLEGKEVWKAISYGVTVATAFWTFYMSIGWKWPLLNLIFYRPNLNGTWSGELVSDWVDENGKTKPSISFYLVIRQTFLRIHFTTFTPDFVGISYSESWSLKKHQGLKNVSYLYRKDTSQYGDNELHEGATELRLTEAEDRILQGKYWSSRKTNGSIKVTWVSNDYIESFEQAEKLGR